MILIRPPGIPCVRTILSAAAPALVPLPATTWMAVAFFSCLPPATAGLLPTLRRLVTSEQMAGEERKQVELNNLMAFKLFAVALVEVGG